MRATVLCLLVGVLVAVALAGRGDGNKGNGKGNQGDNDNGGGKKGKSGGKNGHKCENCMEQKQKMRAQREETRKSRQTLRSVHRESIQEIRVNRTRDVMKARGGFRAVKAELEQARYDSHAEADAERQAQLAAAHEGFTDSISSIQAKVETAEGVLEQYGNVEPLTAFAAEVSALEQAAHEAKRAIDDAAAADIAAVPECTAQMVPQGVCNACTQERYVCHEDRACRGYSDCLQPTPAQKKNPLYSPLSNIMLHEEREDWTNVTGCCFGAFVCSGRSDETGEDADGHLVAHLVEMVPYVAPGCEEDRLEVIEGIEAEADEQRDEVDSQLAHDKDVARAALADALDAQLVIEGADGMNYTASCNKTVDTLRAERDYLQKIAEADQEYYDALIQPRKERRALVKAARQKFRELRRELRKNLKEELKGEKARFRQQQRYEKITKDKVCQRSCPDFPDFDESE